MNGSRHRKFANDDTNFSQLDMVLSRVRRRTREEVASERKGWQDHFPLQKSEDEDEEFYISAQRHDEKRTDRSLPVFITSDTKS